MRRSKIKCQAERPSCSSCRKRQLRCVYGLGPDGTQNAAAVPSAAFDYENDDATGRAVDLPGSGMTAEGGLPYPSSGRDVSGNNLHEATSPFDVGFLPEYSPLLMDSNFFNSFFGEPSLQSNVGWIFNDPYENSFPSLTNSPRMPTPPVLGQLLDPIADPMTATSRPEDLNHSVRDNPNSNIQKNGDSENSWLTEWNVIPVQPLVLPSLGTSDEEVPIMRYYSMLPISSSAREKLLDTLRQPLRRGPWEVVSLEHFPSIAKLDHCVDLYFAHFNRVFCYYWNLLFPLLMSSSCYPLFIGQLLTQENIR
jgi:hypothetical protein